MGSTAKKCLDSHRRLRPQPASVADAPREAAGRQPTANNDLMFVDDTKDRIYVHDLESEIAEIEDNENPIIFIPELDKKITSIPPSVLGGGAIASPDNQMVLYKVPSSLTVSEDRDNVRKAILEARARAREKHVHEAALERATATVPTKTTFEPPLPNGAPEQEVYDPDAMDIG